MVDKEKLLIVGAGGFGRQVSELARQYYDCSFLDDAYKERCMICDIPLIGKTDAMQSLLNDFSKLIVTIGNNIIRESLTTRARLAGYEISSLIYPGAYISPYAVIGEGCVVMSNALIQNGAIVGDGVVLHPGVEIHHDARVDDYAMIYTNTCIRSMAHVGKRAWIDSTMTIPNSIEVGMDCIVLNQRPPVEEMPIYSVYP